jgi:hypothetical protein
LLFSSKKKRLGTPTEIGSEGRRKKEQTTKKKSHRASTENTKK